MLWLKGPRLERLRSRALVRARNGGRLLGELGASAGRSGRRSGGGGELAPSRTRPGVAALTACSAIDMRRARRGNVDAISSVSGGSWASSQYMFADVSIDELVGLPTSPTNATMAALNSQPPAMGARATEMTNKFILERFRQSRHQCKGLIVDSIDWLQKKCQETYMSDLWQDIVGAGVLGPYGLDEKAYIAPSPCAAKDPTC